LSSIASARQTNSAFVNSLSGNRRSDVCRFRAASVSSEWRPTHSSNAFCRCHFHKRSRVAATGTQPLHRYQSSDSEWIDGAVFGFVLGTDPEAFLLIEARRDVETTKWQYGLARMNNDSMAFSHNGREIGASNGSSLSIGCARSIFCRAFQNRGKWRVG